MNIACVRCEQVFTFTSPNPSIRPLLSIRWPVSPDPTAPTFDVGNVVEPQQFSAVLQRSGTRSSNSPFSEPVHNDRCQNGRRPLSLNAAQRNLTQRSPLREDTAGPRGDTSIRRLDEHGPMHGHLRSEGATRMNAGLVYGQQAQGHLAGEAR